MKPTVAFAKTAHREIERVRIDILPPKVELGQSSDKTLSPKCKAESLDSRR